jgi:hypothetical protein
MFDYLKKLEKVLIHALMVMMALVLLLATVESSTSGKAGGLKL